MDNLLKFAYLLDNDNYMVENKIFIDLMWHIAKEKMVSKDARGRTFITAKSYVIRNSGVMFQQIFYWHFNAIKQGKSTKYQYKGKNTVKMDFEDWWNACRLTDKEVSTANKFLIDSGLIEIQKMRIKQKDSDVFKPSNCYIINTPELEKYLSNIIDINKAMYEEKVIKVREENIKTSLKSKKSTNLSTEDDDTPETGVTNKSNTSLSNTSCTDRSDKEITPLSYPVLLENLKSKIPEPSFNTWFKSGIKDFNILSDKILIITANSFTKDILENRYLDIINKSINEITRSKYSIEFKS